MPIVVAVLGYCALSAAQDLPVTQPADAPIQLNFPENVELKLLVQYVSDRLGLNFVYDEQALNQRVTIRAPAPISRSSLLGLLESVLQMKGLTIVDAEQAGWKRIVPIASAVSMGPPTTQLAATGPATRPSAVWTQVFQLKSADLTKAEQAIKPFLTQPGGNALAVPEQRLLIVTDYAPNIQKVGQILSLMDQSRREVVVRFLPVTHLDAQVLAPQLTSLVTARVRALSGGQASAVQPEITAEPRTNQIVFIGDAAELDTVSELARALDVPLGQTTRTYRFTAVAPERIDRLTRELIGPLEAKRVYQSTIDKDTGLLVVTATDSIHARLAALKQDLDVPASADAQSPIRFYRLENTTATDVLATLQAIGAGEGMTTIGVDVAGPAPPVAPAPSLGSLVPSPLGNTAVQGGTGYVGGIVADVAAGGPTTQPGRQTLRGRESTVTADPNTNTIIVVAKPDVQRTYEQLIRTLDKRRPQVLIECTLVTLDTTDNASLGVEISGMASIDGTDIIAFSSFGLSRVGTARGGDLGKLTLIPGMGFNGTVISSDVADLVVKALVSSGRAEVISAPKILVNDNTTGSLTSVQEAPFTSINASTTVATTSFAGYASAGTTIALTPHISEGDFLQLEYTVSLNAFTGESDSEAGTPPPRQTNQLQSKVTIPDGSTIVVGGLNRKNTSSTVDAVPILGEIPILKYLFSSTDTRESTSTLFVFIRPIILRDDRFAELKFFSRRDAQAAKLAPEYPVSAPLILR